MTESVMDPGARHELMARYHQLDDCHLDEGEEKEECLLCFDTLIIGKD